MNPEPVGPTSDARRPLRSGHGRGARAVRGSIASAVARLATAVSSVIAVPILLEYLGLEGYGLWVTAATLVAWVSLANLGLPMSLLNRLAGREGDERRDRDTLVSTFWWLSVGLGVASLLLLAVLDAVNVWPAIFGATTPELEAQARLFAVVMWAGASVAIPMAAPMIVLRADQRVDAVATVNTLGAVLRLAALLVVVGLDAGVGWLVVASAWVPLLLVGVVAFRTFGHRVAWPRPRSFDRLVATRLLATGLGFVGIAAAALAMTSIDVLLVAQLLGPAEVPVYSVSYALLILFGGVAVAMLDGLWPAYAEAVSRGASDWVSKAHRHATRLLVLAAVAFAAGLVLFGVPVIERWAGPDAVPPVSLLVVFGLIAIAQSVELPHGRILMTTGNVGVTTRWGLTAAVVNIPVSVILGVTLGVTGVAIGTLAAYLVVLGPIVRAARRAILDIPAPSGHAGGTGQPDA